MAGELRHRRGAPAEPAARENTLHKSAVGMYLYSDLETWHCCSPRSARGGADGRRGVGQGTPVGDLLLGGPVFLMASPAQRPAEPDVKARRREAGLHLKRLREAAGLTQAALAARLGLRYYTFVSQVEGGHGRLPPEQIESWALALGVSPRSLAIELLRWYEPALHRLIIGDGASLEGGCG